jgi:lipid II:glycine glycyltransferase (peptidoglycan interpeptide bridge formation enzyme)
LQTAQWGKLKADFGWAPHYLQKDDNGALILLKKLFLGFSLAYIPKGPLGSNWQALTLELDAFCHQAKVVVLKVEPALGEEESKTASENLPGFKLSSHAIQPRQTILISLDGSEEEWLARMKQKTRYNIRLAEKKTSVLLKMTMWIFLTSLCTQPGNGMNLESMQMPITSAHTICLPPLECVRFSPLIIRTCRWQV